MKIRKIHRKTPAPEAACNFIKKETLAQVSSFEFCENSKNITSLQNTSGWLLLYFLKITSVWLLLILEFVFKKPGIYKRFTSTFEREYYKTRNNGTRNTGGTVVEQLNITRNTRGTLRNNGTIQNEEQLWCFLEEI